MISSKTNSDNIEIMSMMGEHLNKNMMCPFHLDENFISKYRNKQPNWKNVLSYFVYKRTYSRIVYAKNKDGRQILKKIDQEGAPIYYVIYEKEVKIYKKQNNEYIFDHSLDLFTFGTMVDKNGNKFMKKKGAPISLGRTEEFWETLQRVIEGEFSILKTRCVGNDKKFPWDEKEAQKKAQRSYELMWEFKFLPPGRGLWMMGTDFVQTRGSMCLNNCFSGETEFITKDGIKKFKDCVNTNQTILSRYGEWIESPIREFGQQELMKVVLTRYGKEKIIHATPEHRWFFKSRKKPYRDANAINECFTKDLEEGFSIPYVFSQGINHIKASPFGIAHGISFGDGTNNHLYLCGKKDRDLVKYFPLNEKIVDKNKCKDGAIRISNLPLFFKDTPSLGEDKSYLYGWLAGYFAADGTCKADGKCNISSANEDHILFVRNVCVLLGIGYYPIRKETRISNLTNKDFTMYTLPLITSSLCEEFFLISKHKKNFINNKSEERKPKMWKVKCVKRTDRKEQVYCATVEKTQMFALEGNILVGNCGFVSTENLDIDGSKPFRWFMDALMLGVGVGSDAKGEGLITIKEPIRTENIFTIPDSREGWVRALGFVLDGYFHGVEIPIFDYSKIRPKGAPIRGFGGVASGPQPLKDLLRDIGLILDERIGQPIKGCDIVDIFNNIGKCVVAGNVRRCLEKSMEVHTKRGLLPIDQVLVTDKVLVHDGSYKHVKKIFKQGKQETIRIKTSMGNIVCTPNHRMAIFNGLKSYTWKEAGKLDPKTDRLLSTPHFEGKNTITPEFAWLIGYYHGDGHSDYLRLQKNGHGGGSLSFAMSKKNYTKGLKEKFDIVLNQIELEPHPQHQGNSTHIRIYDKDISHDFLKYKKPHEMSIIPREIWEGNSEIRSAYLAGICDSDGGVRNTLVWTKYPEFARQIQKIALSLGIATTYHEGRDKVIKGKSYHGDYSVTLRGLRSQKIASELIEPYSAIWKVEQKSNKKNGLSLPYRILIDAKANNEIDFQPLSSGLIRPTKKEYEEIDMGNGQTQLLELKYRDANYDTLLEKELVHDHWIPIEIESIESNGIHETYDIEVEGDHEFVCENLLVHNSAEIMLGDIDNEEFIKLKENYQITQPEHRQARWASNNSIIAHKGCDYSKIVPSIVKNGEPGVLWLENAQNFSRMISKPDYKDINAKGVNPCFAGDTLIAVADGRNAVPIRQLAEEGFDVPVYSVNEEGNVEIKMGRNPRITGYNKELVKVTLDDGSSIIVTPNHKMRLLNGSEIEAKDLQGGESLPRFSKYTASYVKDCAKYYRIRCNTLDSRKNQYNEHRLIAKFHHPDQCNVLNDESIHHGWLKYDYVVHHRNENTLDNRIENLEIKTFNDHNDEHGFYDVAGEQNPMYGKKHSEHTKELIGITTSQRCEDEKYRKKLSKAIKKGMNTQEVHDKLSESRKQELMKFYKEFEKKTDLDTLWIDDRLYVKKACEVCGKEMILALNRREQSYCSYSCLNKTENHTNARKKGQKAYFKDKQKNTLHKQIMIYKDLKHTLKRDPMRKEWEEKCTEEKISKRFNPKSENEFVLKSFTDLKKRAESYNHRVLNVEKLNYTEDVYNITVDDNHTVGVITNSDGNFDGIFTKQCGEQTLESWELCTLVESFPSHHDSYEEFEETLKYAYLYAKAVTLSYVKDPRWSETNGVMSGNKRIGISQSGIVDAFEKHGRDTMLEWSDKGYQFLKELDKEYSRHWLRVRESIKLTTVKPSGTTSLVAGVSAGIHYPHSEYYIRRVRLSSNSALIPFLKRAHYEFIPEAKFWRRYPQGHEWEGEPIMTDEPYDLVISEKVIEHEHEPPKLDVISIKTRYLIKVDRDDRPLDVTTVVVEFPIHTEYFNRCKKDVSMWEQLQNAADYQKWWSDNQVSVTASFTKRPDDKIKQCIYDLEQTVVELEKEYDMESSTEEKDRIMDEIHAVQTEIQKKEWELEWSKKHIYESDQIEDALKAFEGRLKSVSFLPLEDHGYDLAPYEEISKEEYMSRMSRLGELKLSDYRVAGIGEEGCEDDTCIVKREINDYCKTDEKIESYDTDLQL